MSQQRSSHPKSSGIRSIFSPLLILTTASFVLVASLLAPAQADSTQQPITIVALGDSLTAGFGLRPADAFPVQLQRALRRKGHNVKIVNAGVSGDTANAGLRRFEWAVPKSADALILELGANDALRALPPKNAEAALGKIIKKAQARGLPVLVAGMYAPRNLGRKYVRKFDAIFPRLAKRHGTLLYPFFLDGVARKSALNLRDGIHPNARGIAIIVKRILPSVEQLLERAKAKRAKRGRG